jgi:dTDP-4-dehydrorhamnose 3,5-epimerase
MEIEWLDSEGLFLITPDIHQDSRGYFFESFNAEKFKDLTGIDFESVQDNESVSSYHVMRGFHFQKPPFEQAKLVRAIEGEVLDVVVDIRKNSQTFGQAFSVVLSGINKKQLYVPKGFAHAFLALSEKVTFFYKVDAYYHRESDSGIRFNDPEINFQWPIDPLEMIISEKDQKLPLLKDIMV